MKYLYLVLVLILFSCRSKQNVRSIEKNIPEVVNENKKTNTDLVTDNELKIERFVVLKPLDLKSNQLKIAETLGGRLLGMCNNFKFKKFNSQEATQKVINNIDLEKMTKTCQKIFFRNGKYINLELIEIRQDNLTGEIGFRFNIVYEKNFFKRELKLILNQENKLSFIATKQISKIIK